MTVHRWLFNGDGARCLRRALRLTVYRSTKDSGKGFLRLPSEKKDSEKRIRAGPKNSNKIPQNTLSYAMLAPVIANRDPRDPYLYYRPPKRIPGDPWDPNCKDSQKGFVLCRDTWPSSSGLSMPSGFLSTWGKAESPKTARPEGLWGIHKGAI